MAPGQLFSRIAAVVRALMSVELRCRAVALEEGVTGSSGLRALRLQTLLICEKKATDPSGSIRTLLVLFRAFLK